MPRDREVQLSKSTPEDANTLLTDQRYLLQLLDQLSELELLFDVVHIVKDGLVRAGLKHGGSVLLNYYVSDDHPLLRRCRREVLYSRLHPDRKKKFKDCDEMECPRLSPFAAVIEGRNNMLRGSIPDHRRHLFDEGYELVRSAYSDFNKAIFGAVEGMQPKLIGECVIGGIRKSLNMLTYNDILNCPEGFRHNIFVDLAHMWVGILPEMMTRLIEVKRDRVPQETSNLVCALLDYMAVKNARVNPRAGKRQLTGACLYFEGWIMSHYPFFTEYWKRARDDSWRFLEVRRNVHHAAEIGNALMKTSSYPLDKRIQEPLFRQPERAYIGESSEKEETSPRFR